MFYHSFFYTLIGALLIALPGCSKQSTYQSTSLKKIEPKDCHPKTIDDVTIAIKPLTKKEADILFNGKAGRLLRKRKPIYPFILKIENKSNDTYLLDPKNISLRLVKPAIAATRLHSHTHRRMIGSLLVGIIGAAATFFAAAYLTIIGAVAAMPAMIKAGYASLGLCGFFVIGSPLISYQQGKQGWTLNQQITQDIMSKSLSIPLLIKPNEPKELLLFAHHTHSTHFSLSLVDITTSKRVVFDIDLEKEGN